MCQEEREFLKDNGNIFYEEMARDGEKREKDTVYNTSIQHCQSLQSHHTSIVCPLWGTGYLHWLSGYRLKKVKLKGAY